MSTWCFRTERLYNVYHQIPKGGRGGAIKTLVRWHGSMHAFRLMAYGSLAPDCHAALLGPAGLIAKAIARPVTQLQDPGLSLFGRITGSQGQEWESYATQFKAMYSADSTPFDTISLVSAFLEHDQSLAQEAVLKATITGFRRMRLRGTPYATIPPALWERWEMDELADTKALVAIRRASGRVTFAVALAYYEVTLFGQEAPFGCYLCFRPFHANPRPRATAIHRMTGFPCINTAWQAAGQPEVCDVSSVIGPAVYHLVFDPAAVPGVRVFQTLSPRSR